MSSSEPYGPPTGAAVNQFGTPVNQFGTPGQSSAPNQFGAPNQPHPSTGGWSQPAAPQGRRRSSRAVLPAVVAALAVLVAVGLALRFYVFPDLSKPIALPDTMAGVGPLDAGQSQPVTVQTKDAEGRAMAMGVYADSPTQPRTMIVVTAGRVKGLPTGPATEPTTRIGKVTCTQDVDAAEALQQSGAAQSANAAILRAMTTGAACWRTGRHLTVMVVVLAANGPAGTLAAQAVDQAWDDI